MRLFTLAFVFAASGVIGVSSAQIAPTVALVPGMVIDRSMTVTPGVYRLPSASLDRPAIVVRGSGLTLNLTGVTIEGGAPDADPDGCTGIGILVDAGANVTIRGGAVRGYKIGVRASQMTALTVTDLDASYNYKQRLWSGIEKESLLDWMSYHQNEQDEWLRYGAAIYVTDCERCVFERNVAVQGENGLMLTRVNHSRIAGNNFSFNSALGLGMYRSSDNTIADNRLDYDVRGFSHGYYYRGQDSSAILIYEQSHRNTFTRNSATHGGDGLFLWAGQSTMDTGEGGVNDNVFADNDFSYAVANGIETTFSRNRFTGNRIVGCWHGVWGGYSYDTVFEGNTFADNTEHIAIEHGQRIKILDNALTGGDIGIRLWANASQDPNWGYPKHRDTRSHGYEILGNTFDGVKQELQTLRTDDVVLDSTRHGAGTVTRPPAVTPERQGRDTIIVDEWGPYDYKSPKLWPVGSPWDRPLKLKVLGPAGRWTLKSIRGGSTPAKSGTIGAWPAPPEELPITLAGDGTDLEVVLEYVGAEVVSPRGARTPAGQPYLFRYQLYEPATRWAARAWVFDETSDPIKAPAAFERLLRSTPAKTWQPARFAFIGGGTVIDGLPRDGVAIDAEASLDLAGPVSMDVISDDGIRVWVDGRLVIDRWSVHESVLDQVALSRGGHRIKLQYFEQSGWAELQVRFRRD
jgi:parallel beta-helix repeat protein